MDDESDSPADVITEYARGNFEPARGHVRFGVDCGGRKGGHLTDCGGCYAKHLVECADRVAAGDVTKLKAIPFGQLVEVRGPKGATNAARRRSRRRANKRARTARRRNRNG